MHSIELLSFESILCVVYIVHICNYCAEFILYRTKDWKLYMMCNSFGVIVRFLLFCIVDCYLDVWKYVYFRCYAMDLLIEKWNWHSIKIGVVNLNITKNSAIRLMIKCFLPFHILISNFCRWFFISTFWILPVMLGNFVFWTTKLYIGTVHMLDRHTTIALIINAKNNACYGWLSLNSLKWKF